MVQQTNEAKLFIRAIHELRNCPGAALDRVLIRFAHDEARIRRAFGPNMEHLRTELALLAGLVDVFAAPSSIRTTRARVVTCRSSRYAKHVMPLPESNRRKDGSPSIVSTLGDFQQNWRVFTKGLLQDLNWDNVVAAGGAVLACVLPVKESDGISKRTLRKYYKETFPSSDIYLSLYGLDLEQAKKKITEIYNAIRNAIPHDVTVQRTKYTILIKPPPPYRAVQIVLRLYHSPAEIITGFDVDCTCFLYNGLRVYASPRGLIAAMRQSNTVVLFPHSPTYELELAKYAVCGFEIYLPTLDRDRLNNYPCETCSPSAGLAMLAKLEWRLEQEQTVSGKLTKFDEYLNEEWGKRQGKGLKESTSAVEGSDPSFSLATVTKQVSEIPLDNDVQVHQALSSWHKAENSQHAKFANLDDWCAEAYLGEICTFFEAIHNRERQTVLKFLERERFDPNQRDASGDTALRVALLLGEEGIASDILDAGARPDIGMEVFVNKLVESVLTLEEQGSDDGSEEYLSGSDIGAVSVQEPDDGQEQPCRW